MVASARASLRPCRRPVRVRRGWRRGWCDGRARRLAQPVWDAAARRVLAHDAGPLRVLGGPGTGKTTLLLAAVAARVAAGADPSARWCWSAAGGPPVSCGNGWSSSCTPAAARCRTSREPLVRTVHSYAFGVLRLHAARNGDPPPRLLASAEQDAVVRDLLAGELAGGRARTPAGRPGCARRSACPASPPSCASCCCAPPSAASGPDELTELGQRHDVAEWVGRRPVLPQLRARDPAARGGRPRGAAGHRARAGRRRAGGRRAGRAGLRPGAAGRRAAAGAPPRGRRRPGPRPAADGAGPGAGRHRGLGAAGRRPGPGRAQLPRRRPGRPAGDRRRRRSCSAPTTAARPRSGRPARGWPPGCPAPGPAARRVGARRSGRPRTARSRCGSSAHPPRRPAGWPTSCAAPTSRRRAVVADGRAGALHPAARCRRCAGRCWPPGCRSPRRPTSCRWPASRPWCRC